MVNSGMPTGRATTANCCISSRLRARSWNGWRWGRWAGLLAVALTGGFAALTHDWGFVAVGLAVVGSALLWLPPVSRYLADWDRVRAERPVPYRRPESIFYGRLPRFR